MTAPATTAEAVDRLLSKLKSALGTKEVPDGSNHTFIVDWYNENVDRIGFGPWCQMTVTWAFFNCGYQSLLTGTAWTIGAVHNAQAGLNGSKWFKGTSGMRKGDQVYYDWTGRGLVDRIDHVGTVETISRDGSIYALEGNASNRVRRMHRDSKYIVGYVRPDWSRVVVAKPKPVPAPPKPVPPKPTPPKPVPSHPVEANVVAQVKVIQGLVHVTQDGIWGPKTDAAFLAWRKSHAATKGQVQLLQKTLGNHLAQDGIWGPLTDNAVLTFRKQHLVK